MNPSSAIDLQVIVREGLAAREELNNPTITKTFAELEEGLVERWKTTKADDVKGREEAYGLYWSTVSARKLWEERLTSTAQSGTMAARELEREQYAPEDVRNGVDDSTGLPFSVRLG